MGERHELGIESSATLAHHPIHPLLVPFPIASIVGVPVADVVYLLTKNSFWAHASYWLLVVGILTGLAAALVGTIDYLSISSLRKMRTAQAHAFGNGVVMLLAAANLATRWPNDEARIAGWGIALSIVSIALLSITGWLGGSLSYKYHLGAISPHHGGDVPEEIENFHALVTRKASQASQRSPAASPHS